eukprot:331403-Pelagomonas_calceolata.AAC.3
MERGWDAGLPQAHQFPFRLADFSTARRKQPSSSIFTIVAMVPIPPCCRPQHGKKKLTKQQLLEAAEAKAQEAAAAEGNEEAKVMRREEKCNK